MCGVRFDFWCLKFVFVLTFSLSFSARGFWRGCVGVLMYSMWRDYTEMCCEVFCSLLPVLPVGFHRVCVRVSLCVMVNVYHVCDA